MDFYDVLHRNRTESEFIEDVILHRNLTDSDFMNYVLYRKRTESMLIEVVLHISIQGRVGNCGGQLHTEMEDTSKEIGRNMN